MRDILPRERATWRAVEKAAADVAVRFGYVEIVTPVIEHAELIERVGEDTDAVAKELYRFDDRGGRHLALRPEATAGFVRAYSEAHLTQEPQPSRLYLIGPMFRYNRPQKGRYRQFFQFDVEAIGSERPALDAEVIEVAATWLRELGLRELRLELNTIGDSKCRPAYLELLKAYYRPLKDQLHADCQHRLETNPLLLLDCKVPQDQPFKAKAPRITDHLCEQCAAAWAAVKGMLDGAGIAYRLDPYLVRGLDYYTRTVFEFFPANGAGAQDALGGGGRYDGLAEAEGWPATPGVGFASGLDRVIELVQAIGTNLMAATTAEVAVLSDIGLEVAAAGVARLCRTGGSFGVAFEPKSLKAKMKSANKVGARWVVLLTASEAARKVAQLKEMGSGEQVEVAWADLPARLA